MDRIYVLLYKHSEENMTRLNTYADFLQRVEETGFLPLSHMLPGLPSLSEETLEKNWHTGDPDTDPWQWKDRAATEKRLAYGCILGGQKGFIAPRLYASFYVACHPSVPMPDRRAEGEVPQAVWEVWSLFQKKCPLSTSEIRKELGVTQKQGGSRIDAATTRLQQEFYLTVAGTRRKIAGNGQPFGWPSSNFDRVLNWAPAEWLSTLDQLHAQDAWETILAAGIKMAPTIQRSDLARALGIPM
jgi:hypothetical protein